ncbi:hypothetical protein DB30_01235 [Enhygromyxa salina]|uniref:Uncharacterized protein n=1 Tax=Enhygromyxa salina TaxID=215803 RepID=A0A0C2CXL8_9BACT|nr:hypothetical protein [Enhygromyxa salina]KIG12572.1 hypothetical protein DB30_01235 [Enhygromyxa salina]
MFIKHTILAILAACGINNPDGPDDKELPPPPPDPSHYFCCHTVDADKLTGEGCVTIGANQVDSCASVLHCANTFTKMDGEVKCEG